jgi:hypothetical protein
VARIRSWRASISARSAFVSFFFAIVLSSEKSFDVLERFGDVAHI